MSRVGRIVPPQDLLGQVEGVEDTLRRAQKLGVIGWVAFVASALQVAFLLADNLVGSASRLGSSSWLFALAVVLLALSLVLINWRRIWLRASQQPFRYTYSVAEFEPVAGNGADPPVTWPELRPAERSAPVEPTGDAPLAWLRHDLTEKLSHRVRRLSLLEERYSGEVDEPQSHIHVGGSYGIRKKRSDWTIEVVPWIRLGPPGSPARLAHAVTFPLGSSAPELDTGSYEKLRERIYFSIATQLYRQIRKDVQKKIDLLPGRYFKAAAYFHEAKDYSRSNTLDAYEQARDLYASVLRLYDPLHWPSAGRSRRRIFRHIAAFWPELALTWRWQLAQWWPRLGRIELMVAKAEIGYANALLDRRMLAGMSGQRLNPVYEALPVSRRALQRLEANCGDVAGLDAAKFDAFVTLAAVYLMLGAPAEAEKFVKKAVELDPVQADQEPRYLYVKAGLEARPEQAVQFLRRAVELAPGFEAAQFALAIASEMFWRTRPTLEKNVAKLVAREYESVLMLNPGNIAAWANLGYIHWLLGDLPRAEESLLRGRDYKDIQGETFVAELDYGLARVAAERGDFEDAYKHYINAVTALFAQGFNHASSAWYTSYHFERINRSIVSRFAGYHEVVQRKWETLHDPDSPDMPKRVVDAVYAFVLNDIGEACFNYFLRSYDRRFLDLAQGMLEAAESELKTRYSMIYLNLARVLSHQGASDERIEEVLSRVTQYAPHWPDGKLERSLWQARGAREAAYRADALARRAAKLKQEAHEKQEQAQALLARLREQRGGGATSVRADGGETGFWAELLAQLPRPVVHPADGGDSLAPLSSEVDLGTLEQGISGGPLFALWSDHLLRSPVGKTDEATKAEAAALRQEAAQLLKLAKDARREVQRARDRAKHLRTAALRTPASLLPHEWLWVKGRRGSLDRSILHRVEYALERKLERELDDLHVRALFAWCAYGSTSDAEREGRAEMLDHLLKHFLPDDFDVLRECRARSGERASEAEREAAAARAAIEKETDPDARAALEARVQELVAQAAGSRARASECESRMAIVVENWMARDPAWWSLYRADPSLEHVDVRLDDRTRVLREAAELRGLPDRLYIWIAERLADRCEQLTAHESPTEEQRHERAACWDAALTAFANAAATDDPTVLFMLGETLERQADAQPAGSDLAKWLLTESVARFERSRKLSQKPGSPELAYLPTPDPDQYRRALATVRWKLGQTGAAVDELAAIDSQQLSSTVWRAEFIGGLLDHDLVASVESYRALKDWLGSILTRAKVAGNEIVLHDAAAALLGLTRRRYQSVVRRPHDRSFGEEVAAMAPVMTPLIVDADERLLPDAATSDALRNRLADAVQRVANETGVAIPEPQILSVAEPRPGRYTVRLDEVPIAAGVVPTDAIGSVARLDGIARHLEAVVRRNLASFLGLQEVVALLVDWHANGPGDRDERSRLLERSVPDDEACVALAPILRGLAVEGVPLNDLTPILRRQKAASAFPDRLERVEYVRSAVAATLPGTESSRRLLRLPSELEDVIAAGARSRGGRRFLALPGKEADDVRLFLSRALADVEPDTVALVVCTSGLRPFVRRLVASDHPTIPVLALDELSESRALAVERLVSGARRKAVT